jgi:hypothetical protein
MNPLISAVIGVMVVVSVIVIVVPVIYDVIEQGTANARMNQAKTQLAKLDSVIRELSYEADGAKRSVKLDSRDGYFVISGKDDSIKYITDSKISSGMYKEGNMIVLSGSYVSAYEKDVDEDGNIDLVLENNNLLVAFEKMGSADNYDELNTSTIISLIRNKRKNIDMFPIAEIKIDNTSSYGNGYSELVTRGDAVGTGIVRIVMNSTIDYEVFFSLAPGADWFEMEVKLI